MVILLGGAAPQPTFLEHTRTRVHARMRTLSQSHAHVCAQIPAEHREQECTHTGVPLRTGWFPADTWAVGTARPLEGQGSDGRAVNREDGAALCPACAHQSLVLRMLSCGALPVCESFGQ